MLFVPKKDKKLQLCVDYTRLNTLTIKNCYLLPLISELQDRIQSSQWFTTINIRETSSLIRMRKGEE